MPDLQEITAVIPARYASSRFPGKPLALIQGKPMILHVLEQALNLGLREVHVATDDQRIAEVVEGAGGQVVMTAPDHPCGTDRIAEAARQLSIRTPYILNIQGDEPLLPSDLPQALEELVRQHVQIGTILNPLFHPGDLQSSTVVKAVLSTQGKVLYFSRAPIPFIRDEGASEQTSTRIHFRHLGIYLFKTTVLETLTQLAPSPLEKAENLEQLRWLEHGYSIHATQVKDHVQGVDTPQDLERMNKIFLQRSQGFFP